jgi:hypothetical protein
MRSSVVVAIVFALCCPARDVRLKRTIIPWAWERREFLSALPVTEVAFLAGTISSRGEHLELRPRMQPLLLPPHLKTDPVFRIETRTNSFAPAEISRVVTAIARQARMSHHAGLVQIDFDATASQRPLYGTFLRQLRAALPPTTRISITALASWCMDDRWLQNLPIDEAVPMLFRMGPETESIRRRLQKNPEFAESRCRGSAGFGTDEPLIAIRSASRVYVFDPKPWTADALRTMTAEVAKW